MLDQDKYCKEITEDVSSFYHKRLKQFLLDKNRGSITEAEVIILIMNICIAMSVQIYFSIKDYLPNAEIDFDFSTAKIINAISDSFKKIKEYDPGDGLIELSKEQIKEILDMVLSW